jgi:hypothetical protein
MTQAPPTDPDAAAATTPPPTVLVSADRSTLLAIALTSGVAFIACWLPAPDAPGLGSSDADAVRAWIAANSTALRASAVAIMLVSVTLVATAAGLVSLARRRLSASLVPDLTLACAVVVGVVLMLDIAASTTGRVVPQLLDTTISDVTDPVVVGWLAVGGYAHYLGDLNMVFISVLLACGSQLALRLRLTKRWLCYLGMALGACGGLGVIGLMLAVPALYPLWFAGMFGLYLGLLVLSISCLLSWRRLASAPRSSVG